FPPRSIFHSTMRMPRAIPSGPTRTSAKTTSFVIRCGRGRCKSGNRCRQLHADNLHRFSATELIAIHQASESVILVLIKDITLVGFAPRIRLRLSDGSDAVGRSFRGRGTQHRHQTYLERSGIPRSNTAW